MKQQQSPKVFLSHASEDKKRFVLEFAKKLRANGIEAWLDKWEMFPGDSLVDKIFEEGLKDASTIIVVLSKISVEKPWVREEINTSVVKKIEKGCKLIPIVIDDCEVPECLRSTMLERIHNLGDYDESLHRIVASIFGHREKPIIGKPPQYTQENIIDIPDLTKTDSLVLKLSCEDAIVHGNLIIEPEEVFTGEIGELLIPETELSDSLDVLDRRSFISLHRTTGVRLYSYLISSFGFEQFANAYISDYPDMQRKIMQLIAQNDVEDNQKLVEMTGYPKVLVDHVLELLEEHDLLKQGKCYGGVTDIYNISPEIRRMLEG